MQAMEVMPTEAVPATVAATPVMKPAGSGQWSSGCCDCFTDCRTCCAGCWCPCFPIAQLSARMKGEPGRFPKVLALMWVIMILYISFYMYFIYGPEGYSERLTWALLYGWWEAFLPENWSASYFISMIGFDISAIGLLVVGTCLICTARNRILERDGIEEGGCATCCISCCPCSSPCATCQMMRHEGFHEDGYSMCHPTGKDLESATPQV